MFEFIEIIKNSFILNKLFYVIIFMLFIVIILIIYLAVINNFVQFKKKNFSDKIIKLLKKHNIGIDNKIITFLIGREDHKDYYLNNLFIEFSYNVIRLDNLDPSFNIREVLIVDFGDSVIISIIENFSDNDNVYIDSHMYILKLLEIINYSNKCIHNIVILVSYEDMNNHILITRYRKIIKTISEYLSLYIPIYFIFDILHQINSFNDLVKFLPSRFLQQMLGFSFEKTYKDVFNIDDIKMQTNYLLNNINSIILEIMPNIDSLNTKIMFSTLVEKLRSEIYNCAFYIDKFFKGFISIRKPFFRSCLLTGIFSTDGDYKYMFVADLFLFKIIKENTIIDVANSDIRIKRSTTVELILFITCGVLIIYNFLCYENMCHIFNHIELSNEKVNRNKNTIDVLNNKEKVNLLIQASHDLDFLNNKFTKCNLYYSIISILTDIDKKIYILKSYIVNCLYTLINSDIESLNNKIIDLDRKQELIQDDKSDELINIMLQEQKSLYNVVNLHNDLKGSFNDIEIFKNLLYKLYNIDKKIITNASIKNINILNYENISFDLDNMHSFSQNLINRFINTIFESIEKTYFNKVKVLTETIDLFFSDKNVDKRIRNFNKIIELVESIDEENLSKLIRLDVCVSLVKSLEEINYISNNSKQELLTLIKKSSYQILCSLFNIKSIIIPDIFESKNKNIQFSKELLDMISIYKKMQQNSIYKKYLVNSNYNNIIKKHNEYYIIHNYEYLCKILEDYSNYIQSINYTSFIVDDILVLFRDLTDLQLRNSLNMYTSKFSINDQQSRIIYINKILNIFERCSDSIESVIQKVYDCDLEEFKLIFGSIMNDIICVIYDVLYNFNIFKENNKINVVTENPLRENLGTVNKDLFNEKIALNIEHVKKFILDIKGFLNIISINKKKIIDVKNLLKYEYIENTLSIIEEWDQDSETSYVNNFIVEMRYMFETSSFDFEKKDTSLLNKKNYFADVYQKYVYFYVKNKEMIRKQYIVDLLNELEDLIIQYKHFYPFNKDEDAEIIPYSYFLKIYLLASKLNANCSEYREYDKNLFYNKVLNLTNVIIDIYNILSPGLHLNFELYSASEFKCLNTICTIKDSKDSEENNDDQEIEIVQPDGAIFDGVLYPSSEFQIEYNGLVDNNSNFIDYVGDNVKSNYKKLTLFFNGVNAFNIVKLASEQTSSDPNQIKIIFSAPIKETSVNVSENSVNSEVNEYNIVLNVNDSLHVLTKNIVSLCNIINVIEKIKNEYIKVK
ncbi:hypothetical protein AB837_00202 [bacterium AB1]|nr:hypothetical protein AB837_00202 [bacterium AB1]